MYDEGKITIQPDDLHQIVTYMHILNLEKGIFISPTKAKSTMNLSDGTFQNDAVIWKDYIHHIGTLNGKGGEIIVISASIPECEENDTFETFANKMKVMENGLVNTLKNIHP
jgi:hypothetical protein